MKKILALAPSAGITSESYTANRLCIIKTMEHHMAWYVGKLNAFYIDESFGLILDKDGRYTASENGVDCYGEVLEVQALRQTQDMGARSFTEMARELIAGERYVYLLYDEYGVPCAKGYRKGHAVHDLMVYGFDESDDTFLCHGNFGREKLQRAAVHGDDLFHAHCSSIALSQNASRKLYPYNLPASAIGLKSVGDRRTPDLDLFFRDIADYCFLEQLSCSRRRQGELSFSSRWYGIAVYPRLYNELVDMLLGGCDTLDLFSILHKFYGLVELKQEWKQKLLYLDAVGALTIPEELLDQCDAAGAALKAAFDLLMKYVLSSNNKILDKLRERLKTAEQVDSDLSSRLYEHMYWSTYRELL